MSDYIPTILTAILALSIAWILTLKIENHEKEIVITSYVQEIATLKADATERAARDKSAASVANATVQQSIANATTVLNDKIPLGCDDVRTWAIKQSQGM